MCEHHPAQAGSDVEVADHFSAVSLAAEAVDVADLGLASVHLAGREGVLVLQAQEGRD